MNAGSQGPHTQHPPSGLVRNTGLNFLGELIPLAVSALAIPATIRGLGVERFGILSLGWVIIGYFVLFDLGLGRATTQYMAGELKIGEQQTIRKVVWTSLLFQGALGLIGGIVLFGITPWLVERAFNVAPPLIEETKRSLYWLSVAVPFLMGSSGLRGLLEAGQRFDLVNVIKLSTGSLVSLIPLIGLMWGFNLSGIMWLQTLNIMGGAVAYHRFVRGAFPWLTVTCAIDRSVLRTLVRYAGWTTVLVLACSTLMALDRLLMGVRLSLSAIGYYTPPYTLTSKLWIIPQSVFVAAFPVFSSLDLADRDGLEHAFIHAFRILVVGVGSAAVVLAFLAPDILRVWLGGEFASRSEGVLQILAVGFLVNSLAWVPSTLLQGIGRPDLVAKIFLCELPLYTGLTWWFIGWAGIEGAALAWAVRGAAEAALFIVVVWRVGLFRASILEQGGVWFGFLTAIVIAVAIITVRVCHLGLTWRLGLMTGLLLVCALQVRGWALVPSWRGFLGRRLRQLLRGRAIS